MGEATETALSRRLNWERAKRKKATQSLSDEREFMERDRAARWLEHQEQTRQARLTKAAQPRPKPIHRRRQESNPSLPWER
jgi:hypothetical protein